MMDLLEYIGPILFITAIISYSLYRRFKDSKATINVPKCPKCKSEKLQKYPPKKREYSPRDAIIGQAIGGRNGAMFALLYEADKTHYHCRFCGHNFAIKENRLIRES
ncbi:TPA: hypothetical protein U2D46_000768 [Streptococcus suis]|uniref:Membrane protein n=1 Tax=Streptococcus suis TaxID=1307 RepID=A0A116NS93_STRSU|nr:membrane protein [Streptococcus suis]MBY4975274.1 hypothetical protein [Streptococcus suis]MCK3890862.1 hypothetical protein [Streptococcus suis]MDG4520551.1 hypothetical protein [Streptococcus suis]NQF82674.1 hypothetical protein [Streptococcus suis]NQG59162.1 hypothetical protein [Streptococcus suis]